MKFGPAASLKEFYAFAGRLLDANSMAKVLDLTGRYILQTTPAQAVWIDWFDELGATVQTYASPRFAVDISDDHRRALQRLQLQICRGEQALLVASEAALPPLAQALQALDTGMAFGLPLRGHGAGLAGSLLVFYNLPRRLSAGEKESLRLCANHSAAVFDHLYNLEQSRQRQADLESVIDTAHILTSTLDISELLQQISVRLAWIVSVDACAIASFEPENQRLNVLASYNQLGLPAGFELGEYFALADYPATADLLSRYASPASHLFVDTASPDHCAAEAEMLRRHGFSTCLIQPLMAIGEPIGILVLFNRQPSAFPSTSLRRLRLLSEQVALALINARIYQSEFRQRTLAETLRSISLALSSSLKTSAILDILLDQIKNVIPYNTALVMLVEGEEAITGSYRGYENYDLAGVIEHYRMPLEQNALLQNMMRSGQPQVIPDIAAEPAWESTPLWACEGSWLGAPLVARGQTLGFLVLNQCEPGFYTPEHARSLEMLTSHVALALVNANIYNEAERAATIDFLTGAYNHRHFQQSLRLELERSRRYGQPLSLLMIDLDYFKKVNDTYGHPVGDQILRRMAARLKNELRSSDLLARYGGEEFAILLPNTPAAGLEVLAERLLEAIRLKPFVVEENQIKMTVSIGGASYPQHAEDATGLINAADKSLYRSKQLGRDRFHLALPPA